MAVVDDQLVDHIVAAEEGELDIDRNQEQEDGLDNLVHIGVVLGMVHIVDHPGLGIDHDHMVDGLVEDTLVAADDIEVVLH